MNNIGFHFFRGRSLLSGLSALLLLCALSVYSHAGYLYAKALLAQWLIADAWQLSLAQYQTAEHQTAQHQPVRPWSWADTWPVARLQYGSHGHREDLYVLAGATGNSLAFGPGHMAGTPLPGTEGNSIVGGHRDTHFAFLQRMQSGDQLRVQNKKGEWKVFRVEHTQVRNIEDGPLLLNPARTALQLITCYPFDAISSSGPLRYQVSLSPTADRYALTF